MRTVAPFLSRPQRHRRAALQFAERTHPHEARNIHVPCGMFDGRNEDFATGTALTVTAVHGTSVVVRRKA